MRRAARAIIIHDEQLLAMHRSKFGHEYYASIGGGIEPGETPEQTLIREVREETSLIIQNYKLVFIEEAGNPFGTQLIYVCDFPGGTAALPADSIEASINKAGKNLYEVVWLDLSKLPQITFLSDTLKRAILYCIKHGFPAEPLNIDPSMFKGVDNG